MAVVSKNFVKGSLSFVAIAASGMVFFAMFGPESCGPSDEERQLLATMNALDEVTARGGHVEKIVVETGEGGDESVYRFEAEIMNSEGLAIGRLRGRRVEGFGTLSPRFQWYKTPGVAEEWESSGRWDRWRRDGDRPGRDGGMRRDGGEHRHGAGHDPGRPEEHPAQAE